MSQERFADSDAGCHECGTALGPHDTPPFGLPRHFICPERITSPAGCTCGGVGSGCTCDLDECPTTPGDPS